MKTSSCVKSYEFIEVHDDNARAVAIDFIIHIRMNVIKERT